jgi:hypothetical protein
VPASWGGEEQPVPLDAPLRAHLLRALAALPSADLRAHFGAVADAPVRDTARAVAALDVLALIGTASDLALCAHLASPGAEEEGVPRARRVAFEDALGAIAQDVPDAIFVLRGLFTELHPSLLAPAVRCIADRPSPERLEVLAGLLGRARGIDDLLLVEIARVARHVAPPVDETVRVHVRYALGSRDPNEVVLAAGALGAVEDFDAIPRLVDLLAHDDERIRTAADDALERMTGRTFRGDARAWSAWYDRELEWWRASAGGLHAVEHRDPTVALQTLHDVSGHRLYRHELALAVVPALARNERELVLLACSILRSLDSRAAVPALTTALGRDDPEIAAAALRALQGITGLTLPGDPARWRAAVDPENPSAGG